MLNGRYLVWDHDIDPILPWVDSTQCWVTSSPLGRLSLVLSSHSLGEWRHLVCYQEETVSPRPGLGMCDTLNLDLLDFFNSPRISHPWLSYPSTRSRCHTKCEIKALVTLLVYDDVLWMESKDHRGTWKKDKVKIQKIYKAFWTTRKGPHVK